VTQRINWPSPLQTSPAYEPASYRWPGYRHQSKSDHCSRAKNCGPEVGI